MTSTSLLRGRVRVTIWLAVTHFKEDKNVKSWLGFTLSMQKEIYNWYNYTIIILFPKTQVKGTKLGSPGWWLYCIWHLFFPWKCFISTILHSTWFVSFHLDEILSPLVFGEELKLLGINGAPPLLPDQVDRVLVLHSQFNQRCCNQHRRSEGRM